MNSERIDLTDAEWHVMECLWDKAPRTGRELTEALSGEMGWSRSTTLTLLRRLEGKGAVTSAVEGGVKAFSPAVGREDAAAQEAESFLERVYRGSLSMMVSSVTKKQSLPKNEIDELYALLRQLEGEGEND